MWSSKQYILIYWLLWVLKKKACCAFHREENLLWVPREIICFQTCKRGMVCKILLSCWHSETLLILHHVYWLLTSFLYTVSLLILMSSVSFANLMIRSHTNPKVCFLFCFSHSIVMKLWVTICSFNTVEVANQTYSLIYITIYVVLFSFYSWQ